MKVDFLMTPATDIRTLNNGARIVHSNLMEDSRLDVNFNNINISNFFNTQKEIARMNSALERTDKKVWTIRKWLEKYSFLSISFLEFRKRVLGNIKNDIVLYNAGTGQGDLNIISMILQNGNKMVVGGSMIPILGIPTIRKHLTLVHDCPEKFLKNVIFVDGLVGSKTDIYKIIKDWKDIKIDDPCPNDLWGSKSYYSNYLKIIESLCSANGISFNNNKSHRKAWSMFGTVCIPFRSGCWWRKCAFCTYPSIKDGLNSLKNLEPEYIADKIIESAKILDTKNIYITDDYFVFNKKTKKILRILKDNGIKPCVFTGIKLLNSEKYASNMGEYFDGVKIGIESVNDFTLDRINKGYTRKEVLIAFENIKKYFHKDFYISVNIIMDMITLGESEVLGDFSLLKDIKMDMRENGFDYFFYNFNILSVMNYIKDRLLDGKFMKENSGKSTTGNYYLRELFKRGGVDIHKQIWNPYKQDYKRFDINGKELKSDIDILTIEDLKYLFN